MTDSLEEVFAAVLAEHLISLLPGPLGCVCGWSASGDDGHDASMFDTHLAERLAARFEQSAWACERVDELYPLDTDPCDDCVPLFRLLGGDR